MNRELIPLLLFTAAGIAQTIEGTVANSVTNQPLGGVQVTIAARGKTAGETTTDAQGAFRLQGLPPGEYTANFSMRGFQSPEPKDAARKPFRISATNPVRLDVRLIPLAKIAGRVVDATGAPVPGAVVGILGGSIGYDEVADAQGKFLSDQVWPGSYVVWAQPPKTLKPPPEKAGERMAWVSTFFPGVTDAHAAGKMQVRAGAEVWDLEIRLQAVPVHSLRGVVLDERGLPVPKIRVTLGSNQGLFTKAQDRETQAVAADDGGFEFAGLSDGVWRLSAELEAGAGKLQAFTAETIAGHDVDRIQLRLRPPFAVHGSVVLEAQAGAQGKKSPMLVILTRDGGGSAFHQGAVDAEGRFAIDGVPPGRYVVRPIPPGAPYYLASIRLGERELPFQEAIDLGSGALPLTIFYKSDGGTVRGTVENCGGADIIFYPQDPALQIAELLRRGKCGENGHFQISNMRPGEYYGFAFEQAPGMEAMFFGFSLDQRLINQAVRVTVRSGEVSTVDLRVTPRP